MNENKTVNINTCKMNPLNYLFLILHDCAEKMEEAVLLPDQKKYDELSNFLNILSHSLLFLVAQLLQSNNPLTDEYPIQTFRREHLGELLLNVSDEGLRKSLYMFKDMSLWEFSSFEDLQGIYEGGSEESEECKVANIIGNTSEAEWSTRSQSGGHMVTQGAVREYSQQFVKCT